MSDAVEVTKATWPDARLESSKLAGPRTFAVLSRDVVLGFGQSSGIAWEMAAAKAVARKHLAADGHPLAPMLPSQEAEWAYLGTLDIWGWGSTFDD